MNWINTLAPWQWAIMLAVPPLVVLLYFLKLRRKPQLVPSTFLWRRTIEDIQVNSLWQRLRKNLLLFLQLLFLLALIIACLRPGFRSEQTHSTRKIFMLDNSASMQATDVAPSRFAAAKKAIREQIEAMGSDDVAMLIAFSNRADIRQGFTSDRSRLLQALDATVVTSRTSDIAEALRAAAGLANPGRSSFDDMTDLQVAEAIPAEIEVYSDGRFPNVADFELGNLTPKYIPIGEPATDNVGIVAFSIDRDVEDASAAEAYGRIMNSSDQEQIVTVAFHRDEELIDASEITIGPGESQGVSFRLEGLTGAANFDVVLDRTDSLAVDNRAQAVLRPDRRIEVLVVSDAGQALRTLLGTSTVREIAAATFATVGEYSEWVANNYASMNLSGLQLQSTYDLIIFDNVPVISLPPANTFFFGGTLPESTGWKFSEPSGPLIVIDWDRTDPMMRYVTLGNLKIVQGRSITGPDGSRVLMRGDTGPLLVMSPRGAFLDAVLGFGLTAEIDGQVGTNTNFPILQSFPVFFYAILENLGGAMRHRSNLSIRPGEPAVLNVPPRQDRFAIRTPDGSSHSVERDSAGQVIWTATEQPGLYTIAAQESAEDIIDSFVVNLASAEESQIAATANVQFGYQEVAATNITTPKRAELWRWLLLGGLALLVVEWAVFSRRVFV